MIICAKKYDKSNEAQMCVKSFLSTEFGYICIVFAVTELF